MKSETVRDVYFMLKRDTVYLITKSASIKVLLSSE